MRLPKAGPTLARAMKELTAGQDFAVLLRREDPEVRRLVEQANNEGWNWEDCGYRAGQTGLTPRQLWALVKMSRSQDRQTIPLKDCHGKSFSYRLTPSAQRILHLIDRNLGGAVRSSFPQLDSPSDRQRYLITSLREEAIASSQLEGAAVTREVAKEMLLTGREPRSDDERMILNNYRTIRMLNGRLQEPLTAPLLHEIQAELTAQTLDKPDAAGRLRKPEERVVVWDEEDHQEVHLPPPAAELPGRVEALCAFANAGSGTEEPADFIHPAVRAILLHFWLAYDHPYVDGYGRTARALFYWSMLRSGYWLVEYLTISSVIRNQPKQYGRAFLNTEVDENDLTYFILYHLQVIERSIKAFREYLDRKRREKEQIARAVLPAMFNGRQQAILVKAQKEPDTRFTYESHAAGQGVTLATARADLLDLEARGLLRGNRVGRRFEFLAVPDLEEKLRKLAETSD
jgi:Fic family protein